MVLLHRQEVVDDLETLGALRVVDTANVDQRGETAGRVIAQEAEHVDDTVIVDNDRQLAMLDRPGFDSGFLLACDMFAERLKGFAHLILS